tara:strand:- start:2219 stop:2707 length:489 start_codon:yes stop_codon:yes gene_type:complete
MAQNKWNRPEAPPPPLFFNKKERDLVKQVNDELIERVIGQTVLYYPISNVHTNFHPLYGEAIDKNFLPPIRVYALVEWADPGTTSTPYGVDHLSNITIHFHKRRLTEDQDLYVRVGDFVLYGSNYYEITTLSQPKELFGQTAHKMEISAKCMKARQSLFDGK